MAATTTSQNRGSPIRELEKLIGDLRNLSAGKTPSEHKLQAFPLLDQWSFGFLPAACLVGSVRGNPILGNRARVHTSQLVFVDQEHGWARTWSRCYRLGTRSATGSDSS
jgi:hypothetical protein